MSDIDPELAKLLAEVENATTEEVETEVVGSIPDLESIAPVAEAPTEEPTVDSDAVDGVLDQEFDAALGQKKSNVQSKVDAITDNAEDPRLVKVRDGLFRLLDHTMDNAEIQMNEFMEDRKKADEALAVLLSRLQAGSALSAAEITAIPILIQARIDVTANRSKYIDSIAKLFASLKKNDTINTTSGQKISNDEVLKILSNSTDDG